MVSARRMPTNPANTEADSQAAPCRPAELGLRASYCRGAAFARNGGPIGRENFRESEVRSTAYQLKTARFPAYRDLRLRLLKRGQRSSRASASSLRLPRRGQQHRPGRRIGTGKTHVAIAIGVQAIEHHHDGFGSSRPSNWSMPLNGRKPRVVPVRSLLARTLRSRHPG